MQLNNCNAVCKRFCLSKIYSKVLSQIDGIFEEDQRFTEYMQLLTRISLRVQARMPIKVMVMMVLKMLKYRQGRHLKILLLS